MRIASLALLIMFWVFSFTKSAPEHQTILCTTYSWRMVTIGFTSTATLRTRPGTKRCRVFFKLSGCSKMRFRCTKFQVPFSRGPVSGYPRCSKYRLDYLELKVSSRQKGTRYCNNYQPPSLVVEEDMRVLYRAVPDKHSSKGVQCRVRCLARG